MTGAGSPAVPEAEHCSSCLRGGPGGAALCMHGQFCIMAGRAKQAAVQPIVGLRGDPEDRPVMSLRDAQRIVADCEVTFPGWGFHVALTPEGRLYLQVRMHQPCTKTGVESDWSGRKWMLSPYMVKSEVVQTAFKAVLTAVEHEARERFKYRGRAIFGPHFDVDKLWEVATEANEEARDR